MSIHTHENKVKSTSKVPSVRSKVANIARYVTKLGFSELQSRLSNSSARPRIICGLFDFTLLGPIDNPCSIVSSQSQVDPAPAAVGRES